MRSCSKFFAFLLMMLLPSATLFAAITLPAIFNNGMVLQRSERITIWGTAEPDQAITIVFMGKKTIVNASNDGKWQTKLGPFAAGGPFDMKIFAIDDELKFTDILIGDVWVCSGQSNMGVRMLNVKDKYTDEIAASTNPNIRQFDVGRQTSNKALTILSSKGWKAADPENLMLYSAVAYFFAKELYKVYHVPIGLIHTSWGGTPAAAWMSEYGLREFDTYTTRLMELQQEITKKPDNPSSEPAHLFNGMVAPFIPYRIKGVIWYQGESNAVKSDEYYKLFPALINDWRHSWGQGDFPFVFVQLANYQPKGNDPSRTHWAAIRDAQLKALAIKKTAMAVAIDVGERENIHPANKEAVGKRLALAAMRVAYGDKNIVSSGPIAKKLTFKRDTAIVRFSETGSGLATSNGSAPAEFFIAAADGKYFPAQARIEDNSVLVWSSEVLKPVSVRYAWADSPEVNLINKEGLPASPFELYR